MYNPGKSPTAVWATSCHFCQQPIPTLDFGEGRALVVSGRACCAACADEGAWVRSGNPALQGVLQRRAAPRYLPSVQCKLDLRLPGWMGILAGNLSLRWLDVSEGGLRVLVRRMCAVDDRLCARILYRPRKERHAVGVRVRHVQASAKFPGACIAGLQFEKPSAELQERIRRVHSPSWLPEQDSSGPGGPP